MSLSSDLLSQARNLLTNEPERPKQASLRRAVSAAYYSLFHMLTEDAVMAMFSGSDSADLRETARRAFQHAPMKKAAKSIGDSNPAQARKKIFNAPSHELKLVARTFADLQEARHQADYDLSRSLTRSEAADLVERVEAATEAWQTIRKPSAKSEGYGPEAKSFLAALLIHDQASRR